MCATVAKASRPITLFDVSPETHRGIVKALGDRPIRVAYDKGILHLGSSILHDVDWPTYSKLLRAFGEKHFRHTYQDGTLEIMMSPLEKHEQIHHFLGRIVEMTALECSIWAKSVASTTRRAPALRQGLEPDESYYLRQPAPTPTDAPTPATPPDLAIEVDFRRPKLDRARSYAILGIRELWIYRKGVVGIFHLTGDKNYSPSENSLSLPCLTTHHLTRLVNQMLEADEDSTIREFIAWLRRSVKKSTRPPRKKKGR